MPTVPFLGSYGDISGSGLMFRNKLINGDFRVWQRGTSFSSLASYAYHADRWLADGAVTSVNRSGTQNNVLTVVTQAGTGIAQRIETAGGQFFAGQVYTVSALVNCSVADLTITVTYRDSNTFKATLLSANVSSQVTTGSYVKVSSTFTLANSPTDFANTNCIQVSFTSSVVNTINFQNVQFESGSVATPFEVRPIGTELALCQRYYERWQASDAYAHFVPFVAGSTTSGVAMYYYKQEKRIANLNLTQGGTFQSGGGTFTSLALRSDGRSTALASIDIAGSGWTTFYSYWLRAFNNTATFVGFDAEL